MSTPQNGVAAYSVSRITC